MLSPIFWCQKDTNAFYQKYSAIYGTNQDKWPKAKQYCNDVLALAMLFNTVYIRAYAEQTVTERTDVYRSTRFFAPKMFFRSFKVTNANIETKLEQMCCIHTRLVVCAQEHNDFSGGSP